MKTMKMVLQPHHLYMGDNGAILCGEHSGCSAQYSGRDISGHPVTLIVPEEAAAMMADLADLNLSSLCETCNREAKGGAA